MPSVHDQQLSEGQAHPLQQPGKLVPTDAGESTSNDGVELGQLLLVVRGVDSSKHEHVAGVRLDFLGDHFLVW